MSNIAVHLYYSASILLGSVIFGILFNIIKNRSVQKYKRYTATHEKTLHIITQNFQHESNIKHEIEKTLNNKLQIICELHGKLSAAEERLKLFDSYLKKNEKLQNELNHQLNLNHEQELKLKELNINLKNTTLIYEKQQKIFFENEKKLTIQFESLAHRIFTQHENTINKQNQTTINNLLYPFQEQIKQFQNQIQYNFSQEEKIQHSLTYEIRNLHQLNSKITQETINLTKALKGNNKMQGNWGEVILTRALEATGMREGHEFHLQKQIIQINGRKLQPDVIVHLPQKKEVIIDSKVSLIAYEKYFNSNNKEDRQAAITDHIHSVRTHIASLNKKDYQKSFGKNTLDYILMFIPIESAFITAIEKEPLLLTDAMRHNIMLVSPTTLLIALRTINNLWHYENQNHHAKKLSEQAGRLYDKLRLFLEDLNKIGQYLNKAETVYNTAKNKFSEGKGNIISQIENFKTLGVHIKQPITSIADINESQCESIINNKKKHITYPSDSKNHKI